MLCSVREADYTPIFGFVKTFLAESWIFCQIDERFLPQVPGEVKDFLGIGRRWDGELLA